MGWFGEEEETTDYLGMVMNLPCAVLASLSDLLGLLSGHLTALLGLVFGYLLIVYECLMGFVFSVTELLALKEWWGTEHTVMLIWLALCLPEEQLLQHLLSVRQCGRVPVLPDLHLPQLHLHRLLLHAGCQLSLRAVVTYPSIINF